MADEKDPLDIEILVDELIELRHRIEKLEGIVKRSLLREQKRNDTAGHKS